MLVTVCHEGDGRGVVLDVPGQAVEFDVGRLEDDLQTDLVGPFVQIGLHLGLSVGHHRFAAQRLQLDRQDLPTTPADRDAGVHVALGPHPLADTQRIEDLDRGPLQHPGPDPSQDVLTALPFDDHTVDAGMVQHQPECGAGGTRSDDGDLGLHVRSDLKGPGFGLDTNLTR